MQSNFQLTPFFRFDNKSNKKLAHIGQRNISGSEFRSHFFLLFCGEVKFEIMTVVSFFI